MDIDISRNGIIEFCITRNCNVIVSCHDRYKASLLIPVVAKNQRMFNSYYACLMKIEYDNINSDIPSDVGITKNGLISNDNTITFMHSLDLLSAINLMAIIKKVNGTADTQWVLNYILSYSSIAFGISDILLHNTKGSFSTSFHIPPYQSREKETYINSVFHELSERVNKLRHNTYDPIEEFKRSFVYNDFDFSNIDMRIRNAFEVYNLSTIAFFISAPTFEIDFYTLRKYKSSGKEAETPIRKSAAGKYSKIINYILEDK